MHKKSIKVSVIFLGIIIALFGVNYWASQLVEEVAVVTSPQPPIRKPLSMYPSKKQVENATIQELINKGLIDPAVKNPEDVILEEAPVETRGHLLQ